MGYAFLLPYFLIVGAISELSMIGKNTYRKPVRNMIGWALNSIGNFVGCAGCLYGGHGTAIKNGIKKRFFTGNLRYAVFNVNPSG